MELKKLLSFREILYEIPFSLSNKQYYNNLVQYSIIIINNIFYRKGNKTIKKFIAIIYDF